MRSRAPFLLVALCCSLPAAADDHRDDDRCGRHADRCKTFILATGRRDPRMYAIDLEKALRPANQNTPNAIVSRSKPALDSLDGRLLGDSANIAISEDGKTWKAAIALETGPPDAEYSYPAVIQTGDGLVHVVYTWYRKKVKHVVIDPGKLNLREMKDGLWPE